jgi:hypothetical protein
VARRPWWEEDDELEPPLDVDDEGRVYDCDVYDPLDDDEIDMDDGPWLDD